MPFKPEDLRKAALALTLGGIAGAAIVQSHHDEAKKSRAEKEDPEGTEWICDIVWDLLDDWEPPGMDREDDSPTTSSSTCVERSATFSKGTTPPLPWRCGPARFTASRTS